MLEGIEKVIKAGQNRLHHSIPQQRIEQNHEFGIQFVYN